MFDTVISRAALGGALSFVVILLVLATAAGRSAPGIASASEAEEREERPAISARTDTVGPSLEEARQMIVGTWIQDTDGSIDGTKKGPQKRVFTEDGTLKRYRRTDAGTYELQETVQYALVDKTLVPVRRHPRLGLSSRTSKPPSPMVTSDTMF